MFQGRKYWFSKTLEQRLNMKANHFIKTSERYFRDILVKNAEYIIVLLLNNCAGTTILSSLNLLLMKLWRNLEKAKSARA